MSSPALPTTSSSGSARAASENAAAVAKAGDPNKKGIPTLHDYCKAEARASFRCLEDHSYDRQICRDLFQDYQDCKRVWQVMRKKANRGELE
ncbi:hypothetical protein GGF32_005266 [Allomyces javanicus]|nr:hypothetical protein GGF32_005266 [Allomyces javanicus]